MWRMDVPPSLSQAAFAEEVERQVRIAGADAVIRLAPDASTDPAMPDLLVVKGETVTRAIVRLHRRREEPAPRQLYGLRPAPPVLVLPHGEPVVGPEAVQRADGLPSIPVVSLDGLRARVVHAAPDTRPPAWRSLLLGSGFLLGLVAAFVVYVEAVPAGADPIVNGIFAATVGWGFIVPGVRYLYRAYDQWCLRRLVRRDPRHRVVA